MWWLPAQQQQTPAIPLGRWRCQCGVGHHPHETQCVSCGKAYESPKKKDQHAID